MTSETPSPILTPAQRRLAFRLWTWEGSVATVQITLTSGAFQTGFALYLGCTNLEIGALAAIPAFLGLMQLAVSYLLQGTAHRKPIVQWASFSARLLWVPMLLIPFFLPQHARVGAFLCLILLSSILSNVAAPLWSAWMSDLIPESSRGRYFGRRNMFSGIVSMLTMVTGGWWLDHAIRQHQSGQTRLGFALLFGIATAFALWSFLLGIRSPDVPPGKRAREDDSPAWTFYLAPFRDRNFRQFILFNAMLIFAHSVAANFFTVYQLKSLQLNYTAVQALGAVGSLSGLTMMPLWGYLADKFGNKPIVLICCGLVLLPPFIWLLTFRDNIPGLWAYTENGQLLISYTKIDIILLNLISGSGWAGINLCSFNLMLRAAPAMQRAIYISAVSAAAGIAGGLGPLLGGAILTWLAPVRFPTHGLIRDNYAVIFIVSAALRFVAILALRPLQEKGSRNAGYVLGQLKASRPVGTVSNIRRLAKGGSSESRRQAANSLARLKTPLAVEELVEALDDVALPVRESAAAALGEIGDERATESLMRKLADPGSGISTAAATALGKINSDAAVPALAAAAQLGPSTRQAASLEALGRLTDPRAAIVLRSLLPILDSQGRSAAIRALSEREDPKSAEILLECFTEESEPAVLATLADALGRMGSAAMAPAMAEGLARAGSATLRREILNALGSILGGRDSFYPYLAMDSYSRDEYITKALTNMQRRYRSAAASGDRVNLRLAARARQALTAYAADNVALSLHRLIQIIEVQASSATDKRSLEALQVIAKQEGREPGMEETLLGVFLAQRISQDVKNP